MKLMQSVSKNVTKRAVTVFDPRVETGATEKLCSLENRRRKIVSCNMHSDFIELVKPPLSKVLPGHILNSESDIEENEAV